MKMLTKGEIRLLAESIYNNSKGAQINTRTLQTASDKDIAKSFSVKFKGRKMLKQIELSDKWFNIYKDIQNVNITNKSRDTKDLDDILKDLNEDILPKEEENKIASIKTLKKNFDMYSNYFKALKSYDTEVTEIRVINYENSEKEIEVSFITSSIYQWKIMLPFIDKEGFFVKNNNKYCFMYTPKNLDRYLKKIDDKLFLYHPFEKLVDEMITAYKTDEKVTKISREVFNTYVSKSKGKVCVKLQNKINRFINNSKEFYWEKDSTSPIVWFDSEIGAVGKYCFTNNILLDMSYKDIIEYGLVEGTDLLTGSTSTPAKRVSLATNYEIAKDAEGTCCVTKVRDKGELSNYLSETKTVYPFFARTSGKRNNSATVKDTQDLINPLEMINRVYIK